MTTFLYRCPVTGYKMQGFVADDPTETDGNVYEPLTCALCGRIHLINPVSGNVLGANHDE